MLNVPPVQYGYAQHLLLGIHWRVYNNEIGSGRLEGDEDKINIVSAMSV